MATKIIRSAFGTRKKRILLGLLIFLALVVLAGTLILHSPSFKRYLVKKADDYLQKNYHLSFQAKKISYSLLRFSIEIEEGKIKALDNDASFLQSFSARRLCANLALIPLLSGRLHIQRLEVAEPRVVFYHGHWKRTKTPRPLRKPFKLRIDRLDLTSGEVEYRDKLYPLQASLADILISIQFLRGENRHRGEIGTRNGEVTFSRYMLPITEFDAEIFFDEQNAQIGRLSLRTEKSSLAVQGEVRNYQSAPDYHFQAKGTLGLGEFHSFFDPSRSYSGQLQVNADLYGKEGSFTYGGNFGAEEIAFDKLTASRVQLEFQGTRQDLNVSRISGNLATGIFSGHADLSFLPENPNFVFLSWRDIEPGIISQFLPRVSLPLACTSEGSISSHWTGRDLTRLEGEAQVSFVPDFSPASKKATFLPLQGNIKFRAARGQVTILPTILRLNNDSLKLSGKLDFQKKLDLDLSLHLDDLSKTKDMLLRAAAGLAPAARRRIEGLSLAGNLTSRAWVRGSMTDPQVTFEAKLSDIHVQGEKFPRIQANGIYQKQKILFPELTIEKGPGILTGNFEIDLSTRRYAVEADVERLELSDFQFFTSRKRRAAGRIDFHLGGQGALANPKFSLQLKAQNFQFRSLHLAGLGLEAESDGKVVKTKLDTPEGQTSLEAKIALERPYGIQGKIITTDLKIENLIAENLRLRLSDLESAISFSADFSFPFAKPETGKLTLSVQQISLKRQQLFLQCTQPFQVAVDNGWMEVKGLFLTGSGTEFSAGGRLPIQHAGSGELDISGKINLMLLEPLLLDSQINGILSVQANVRGNLRQPQLRADLELAEGALTHPRLPFKVHGLGFQASADEQAFLLKNLAAGIDKGQVSGRGTVFLQSLPFRFFQSLSQPRELDKNSIDLELFHIDLGSLVPSLPASLQDKFRGLAEGKIHIGGNFKGLDQLEVEGQLDRLELGYSELTLANPREIRFALARNILTLDEATIEGENMFLKAAGKIRLERPPQLEAKISAQIDGAALNPFFPKTAVAGLATVKLDLRGPMTHPAFAGKIDIKEGFFQLPNGALLASGVNGALDFSESQLKISSFQGLINGGSFRLSGSLDHSQGKVSLAQLRLTGVGVQVNYPEGLSAEINASFSLKNQDNDWLLSGEAKILRAFYSKDFYPGTQLISAIRPRQPKKKAPVLPALQNTRLNIKISASEPILIDNNLGRLELAANLNASGSLLSPVLSGQLANRYSGEVIFGKNTFQVETMRADFLGTENIDPYLNIVAHTKMRQDYDDLEISLTISGPLSNLQYSLSSFPPRSQEELASLLITGYGLNRVPRQSADIISDQLLLYFASPLASSVTERLKSWLGAEEISIEPINIATETDPGARFTFRKKVTGQADIIYSVDISNTQRHTWMLDYHLGRDFVIRSFRRDDGSYGSSFSHRLSIDPGRKRIETAGEERAQELKLRNVEIAGELVFAQEVLKKEVDQLKVGSKFNYTTLRAAINDLMTFHRARGYLGVMINPLLKFEDKDVSVTFWISPGNSILLLFRGDDLPKNLKEKISGSWNGRLPQRQAVEVAKKTILNHLRDKGYYEAEVGTEIKQKEKRTDLSFVIAKGDRFRIQQLTLIGNKYLDRASIEKAIRSASKANSLWILVDYFPETEKAIKQLYEENGFLQANIPSPKIALDRRTREINIILTIDEGAPSRVRSLQFKGNAVLSTELIKQGLELSEGKIYRFSLLTGDRNHILNMYKSRGYLDVQVEPTILQDGDQPDIDIQYTIEEGDQHTVSGIEIVGNRRTSDALILRELKSQIGTPLNLENLALSQKSLYDTRLFRSISVYGRSLVEGNPQDKVVVEVEEEPLFQASYGLRYNSEEKLEGFGELDFTNLFGGGRHGLLYYRQSSRVKDLRFSLKEPYLFGKKLNTLFSFSLNKETLATFITDNIEFSLQQQLNLPYDFSLSYFYRTSWIHTYELEPMGPFPFDISLHLSEISAFLVRDKRDHKLDAGKGSFFSLSLTYSPRFLGSDLTYVSFFGQYSLFQTLHPGWVWASNYRIGLADAFDQVLIPSKRFFAGGGDSVRGFQRDFVGPLDPFFLTPEGGESLFVMNQELRFPVSKWLSAVAFYDAGNVYRELTDFNPLDLRHSLGFGLRLNTPVALLRLDYGLNLFPREGERRGVFFLSIGQAF